MCMSIYIYMCMHAYMYVYIMYFSVCVCRHVPVISRMYAYYYISINNCKYGYNVYRYMLTLKALCTRSSVTCNLWTLATVLKSFIKLSMNHMIPLDTTTC